MSEFDSSYGYSLSQLLEIGAPPEPGDFCVFWQQRYQQVRRYQPQLRICPSTFSHADFDCYDADYLSTDEAQIGGWLLLPKHGCIRRGVIVGHGYGGREAPDTHLPIADAALLFPCFRGLSRSRQPGIPDRPETHVLHHIDNRERYILGQCVEDIWLAVSALTRLFPQAEGHIAYLGISFGGGIGALALAWENRIQRAHFNVPSFGHHPLRMTFPTWGSAHAVQDYQQHHPQAMEVLRYYDAAVAARYIHTPLHIAAALADPMVAPPGQFSIYNAVPGNKQLFVLDMGHADYPRKQQQDQALLQELHTFFESL
jgi:cephalosporin-C deacetylase